LTFATIAILLSKIIIYDGIVSFLAGYAMLVGLRRAIFFTVISMGMAGIATVFYPGVLFLQWQDPEKETKSVLCRISTRVPVCSQNP